MDTCCTIPLHRRWHERLLDRLAEAWTRWKERQALGDVMELDEATLRAYFETTLELFGADRVMFGTDWPVCLLRVESYQQWAEMVKRFVSGLSEDEQTAILAANPARVYDL